MRLIPEPIAAIRNGVESVVGACVELGAPEPPWIAVDDGSDRWVALVAARPPGERVRGVVATSSDRGLAIAHRLGVGGAFRLPPSSLGAREALMAASLAEGRPYLSDPAVLGLLDAAEGLHVVSVADGTFWVCQLGEPVLASLFAQLASRLEVVPAIVPWPALVVDGNTPGRVLDCWKTLELELDRELPDLTITAVDVKSSNSAAGTLAALLAGEGQALSVGPPRRNPVHELPAGGQIGWWTPADCGVPANGWLATPEATTAMKCRWRITGEGVDGIVQDVVTTAEIENAQETAAVRVPGWLSAGLRPGTPAGLLVTDLATAAANRGLPLWIPNVDGEALQMSLRLPGIIWVDGPAVPRCTA